MAVSGVSGNGYYLNGQPRTGNADTGNGTYLDGRARNNKQKRATNSGARDVAAYVASLSTGLLDQSSLMLSYNNNGKFDTELFDNIGGQLASNLFDTASTGSFNLRPGMGRVLNRLA